MANVKKNDRWHPDSNWGMEALQASALPLGYATVVESLYINSCFRVNKKEKNLCFQLPHAHDAA